MKINNWLEEYKKRFPPSLVHSDREYEPITREDIGIKETNK